MAIATHLLAEGALLWPRERERCRELPRAAGAAGSLTMLSVRPLSCWPSRPPPPPFLAPPPPSMLLWLRKRPPNWLITLKIAGCAFLFVLITLMRSSSTSWCLASRILWLALPNTLWMLASEQSVTDSTWTAHGQRDPSIWVDCLLALTYNHFMSQRVWTIPRISNTNMVHHVFLDGRQQTHL